MIGAHREGERTTTRSVGEGAPTLPFTGEGRFLGEGRCLSNGEGGPFHWDEERGGG